MSLSKPNTALERPTEKYIKFKNGKFEYWDKKKEISVNIPLPIHFIVLDELATITGWHDESESGIYSNEVHFTTKEILDVKSFKGGQIANGLYGDVKDTIKANGGRYAKSVYAMMNDELVNIQLVGATLASWMKKEQGNTIEVKELGEGKKGATKYKFPIFSVKEDNEKEIEKATKLDEKLQKYLEEYKKKDETPESVSVAQVTESFGVTDEEPPFPTEEF